jgi:hypothetical protein
LIELIEAYASLKEDLEKYEGEFEWNELLDMHFIIYNFVILVVKAILNMQRTLFFSTSRNARLGFFLKFKISPNYL